MNTKYIKHSIYAISFVLIELIGCSAAPKSSEVVPSYVSAAQFQGISCEKLANEYDSINKSLSSLTYSVDNHRLLQTGAEVVTWAFFWPAAFALNSGESKSSALARAKGEMEAITRAIKSNECKLKEDQNE